MKFASLLIAGVVLLNGVAAMAQTDAPAAAPAVEKAPAKVGCGGCCPVVKSEKASTGTNECAVLCEKLNLTDEQKKLVEAACGECKKATDAKEATATCMKSMETILTAEQMKILKEAVEKNDGVCPMVKACMEGKACGAAKTGTAPADVVPAAVPETPAVPAVPADPSAPENK